ncbi:MAG: cell wall hydrolase [Lachnospiraceae bacterium]|nr:cell wall hydrolase [Lachnospiraceae bacterium]
MKEKVIRTLNKACIYTATLLVAVLVFIAFACNTPVNAASPMSSLDKIAGKIKNSDKYYKKNSKSTKSGTEANADKDAKDNTDSGKDSQAEATPGNNTDTGNVADTDKDTQTGNDTNTGNDTGDGNDTSADTDTENSNNSDIMWNENYTEAELRLMSGIIYCEAGSMSEPARIAVANVIINRANSKTDWGHVNTIKEVIYDQKWGVQFSPIKGSPSSLDQAMDIYDHLEDYKGNWKYDQMQNCITAAKKAFSGEKAIPDTFMYFNGSIESSKKKCEEKGRNYLIIDHHIYFE